MKLVSFHVRSLALACLALLSVSAFAAKPPEEWDGLKLVKLKGLDAAYARPGADFTIYTKIMIDPIQVAFAKNWDKKSTVYKQKLSQKELDDIKTKLGALAEETFKEEFSKKNGIQVVTAPGPDVLRFSSAIIDLWPRAVDTQEPGRNYTYTTSAGSATLYAELRDSETNQLIGRVVDAREARNSGTMRWTNSVENTAEARAMVQDWARILRKRYQAIHEADASATAAAAAAQ
jgi:hypothetical protein